MIRSLLRRVDPDRAARGTRLLALDATFSRVARRLRGVLLEVRKRLGGFAILSRADLAERAANLAAAQAEAERWKAQAATLDDRIETLEERIADAERVALDLRARLVCLHGKLATTAATARYQSFTMALESGTPAPRVLDVMSHRQ